MSERIIKFRVWDKQCNQFLIPNQKDYPIQPWYLISFNGEITEADNQGAFVSSNQENYIIQQFTGLLGKNNKEIYEGDLVKLNKNHEAYLLNNIFGAKDGQLADYTSGEIKWFDGGFNVCQRGIGATILSEFTTCNCCPCALEIIGNIFENHELVK